MKPQSSPAQAAASAGHRPVLPPGAWKTNKPNMDINLANGGGTTKVLG